MTDVAGPPSGAGTPVFDALEATLRAERPAALATIVDGPGIGAKLLIRPGQAPLGTLGNEDLDRVVGRDAQAELDAGLTATRRYGPYGEAREETVRVFIETFAPPPRLIIFGAVDFTGALAKAGKLLGYRVTVCDARAVFATVARFPMADEVANDWPDRYLAKVGEDLGPRDAVCVLTHDPKFDIPAIVAALETGVGYLGAMGSRRTHAARVERLREAGVDDAGLRRVMAPIGLDIGSRTPEEAAIRDLRRDHRGAHRTHRHRVLAGPRRPHPRVGRWPDPGNPWETSVSSAGETSCIDQASVGSLAWWSRPW